MRGQKRTDVTKAKMSEKRKGKRYFTNGVKNVFAFECPLGYHLGMTRHKKTEVTNENINKKST